MEQTTGERKNNSVRTIKIKETQELKSRSLNPGEGPSDGVEQKKKALRQSEPRRKRKTWRATLRNFNYKVFKFTPLLLFQIFLLYMYYHHVSYGPAVEVTRFEDVHVMIFVGFAYLMTFLKKYCYSALGFNWCLAALVIQWAMLCQSYVNMKVNMKDDVMHINQRSIVEADMISLTVLITFGALLGLTSAVQLIVISIVETVLAVINMYLVITYFKAADVGRSMCVHVFGTYFGLGTSFALSLENTDGVLNRPNYCSNITAVIGSLFLWVYWPTFNSALTNTVFETYLAIINTYFALAASTVTTFVLSCCVTANKFDMMLIQHSTLSGAVALGSICNILLIASDAVAIGIIAATFSVIGYRFFTPMLYSLGIPDTCGVNNLHGMPGLISGLLSILYPYMVKIWPLRFEMEFAFPEMSENATTTITPDAQALRQGCALGVTLAISIVGGLITGFIVRTRPFLPLKELELYDDGVHWSLPTAVHIKF